MKKNEMIKSIIFAFIIIIGTIILSLIYNRVEATTVTRNKVRIEEESGFKIIRSETFVTIKDKVTGEQYKEGKVFLSCDEHINKKPNPFFTEMCNQHGTRLTSAGPCDSDYSTGLPVGKYLGKTKTDQGTDLRFVTKSNKGETIDKKESVEYEQEDNLSDKDAKDKLKEKADKKYKGKTITYGHYSFPVKNATPAEAFVIQYIHGNTSRDSYVQHAWWAVSGSTATLETIKQNKTDNLYADPPAAIATKANTLAEKALAFQTYMCYVKGGIDSNGNFVKAAVSSITQKDGVFNVDFRKSVTDFDVSKVDVLYDSITNSYRVGPINIKYLRSLYNKELEFCGIENAFITVGYADGTSEKITFEKDTSDFQIVYDHDHDELVSRLSGGKEDGDFYPYPYSAENFYIQMKYRENMTCIKQLQFDFFWMNMGGSYENLTGNAYIVEWEGEVGEITKTEDTNPIDTDNDGVDDDEEHVSWTWKAKVKAKIKNVTNEDTQMLVNVRSIKTIVSGRYRRVIEIEDEHKPPTHEGDDDQENLEEPDPDETVWTYEIPDADVNTDGGKQTKGVTATCGGWDLTIEVGGYVWEEMIELEKGKLTGDGNSKFDSGIDRKLGKITNVGRIEVKVYKILYNTNTKKSTKLDAYYYKDKHIEKVGGLVTDVLLYNRYYGERKLHTDDKKTRGSYTFQATIPSVENKRSYERVGYDVEFIYDGQRYETVEYLVDANSGSTDIDAKVRTLKSVTTKAESSGNKTVSFSKYKDNSYALETKDDRAAFDKKFKEVYGNDNSAIQDDKSSLGYATGTSGGVEPVNLKYSGKSKSSNGQSRIVSTLKEENSEGYLEDEANINYSELKFTARTYNDEYNELLLPYMERIYIRKYENAQVTDNLKEYTRPYESNGVYLDNVAGGTYYHPIYELLHQINLGLIERTHTDLSVSKDLYKANIVVNQQEVTYKYSSLRDYELQTNDEYLNFLLEMQGLDVSYELGLYQSDFYYRSNVYKDGSVVGNKIKNWKDRTEMRAFATYKICVYNDSDTNDVTVNKLADYYDSAFTMVRQNQKAYVLDKEGERYEKTVAEVPYYRIYAVNEVRIGESKYLYNYNSEEDLDAEMFSRLNSSRSVSGSMGKLTGNSMWEDHKNLTADYHKSILKDTFQYRLAGDGKLIESTPVVLSPGERLELFITYEIDHDGFEAATIQNPDSKASLYTTRQKLLGGKNNVAEVVNYSSFYTKDETINGNVSGIRFSTSAYEKLQIAGRVDDDSAPNNINLNKTISKTDNINGSTEASGSPKSITYKTLDKKWFDDDTDSAPVFKIYLRDLGNYDRKITGLVWEDKDSTDVAGTDSSTANGIFDSGEKGIKDITTSLVEKVRINESGKWLEYEFVWPETITNIMDGYKPVTKTKNDGTYEFKNFVSGIYVVRFEYGNTIDNIKFNGQDYENTAYQYGINNPNEVSEEDWHNHDTENLASQATLNNEWHNLENKELNGTKESNRSEGEAEKSVRVSDARDYEPQRLRIIAYSRTIANSNGEILAAPNQEDGVMTDEALNILKDVTAMEANTAKLNFEIERTNEIDYEKYNDNEDTLKTVVDRNILLMKVSKGITASKKLAAIQAKTEDVIGPNDTPKYVAYDIDFGLEKRAYTSLQLDKYLKEIILSKENGTEAVLDAVILDDGRVEYSNDQTMNTKSMLSVATGNGLQGFHYIQMESSYFDDLTVSLKYRIDVINESEADWTSKWTSEKYTAKELIDKAEELEGNYSDKITPLRTGEGIEYGKYAGYYYYTNKYVKDGEKAYLNKNPEVGSTSVVSVEYEDKIVKTTVDQLVDYLDKDTTIANSSTNMTANNAWSNDFNSVDRTGSKDNKYTTGEIYGARGLISNGKYKTDQNDIGSYTAGSAGGSKEQTLENATLTLAKNYPLVTDSENKLAISTSDTINHEDEFKMKVFKRKDNGIKEPTTSGDVGYQQEEKAVIEHAYAYKYEDGADIKHANAYNIMLTKELEPISYAESVSGKKKNAIGRVEIDTDSTIDNSTLADNMKYVNLAEILVYSNTVGRRSFMANSNANPDTAKDNTVLDEEKADEKQISVQNNGEEVRQNILAELKTINKTTGNDPDVLPTIPGNAIEMAKYELAQGTTEIEEELFWVAGHARNEARAIGDKMSELDADATDYITFTEPTGLSRKAIRTRMVVKVIIAIIVLLILGIIGLTGKIVYDKKKKLS